MRVPEPPALTLTPTSSRAIVTVATGEVGRALHAISGPSMRDYAARIGADYVVLDWPGHPDWPMSCKYAVGPAFDLYDRIVVADADVLPGATDLFSLDPEYLWAFDELRFHRARPQHGAEKKYHQLRAMMGKPPRELDCYLNAGLVVASRRHVPLFRVPARPIPPDHCAEQDLFNARLHDLDIAWADLRGVCAEWWTDPDWLHAAPVAWRHFAGITQHADRLAAMARPPA